MTATMVYHAAVRRIKWVEVELALEGDLDLKGFLGIFSLSFPGKLPTNFMIFGLGPISMVFSFRTFV
jgi:hypothetical protein